MKKWNTPEVEAVEISATAFGPYNKEVPDSEKTAIKNEDGVILGYKQQFGEASK